MATGRPRRLFHAAQERRPSENKEFHVVCKHNQEIYNHRYATFISVIRRGNRSSARGFVKITGCNQIRGVKVEEEVSRQATQQEGNAHTKVANQAISYVQSGGKSRRLEGNGIRGVTTRTG